ncbi:MAG: App1 family protein [Phototrophicaceae bacterium]|jgi:phosphatidate phosphatase APP1
MTNWQHRLTRRLVGIENWFDRWRFSLSLRPSRAVILTPYIGYGTPTSALIRGRVLLDKRLEAPNPRDTLWRNLSNTYKRFETDEIPFAQVRVVGDHLRAEATCDEEGFFNLTLLPEDQTLPTGWSHIRLQVVQTPYDRIPDQSVEVSAPLMIPPSDAQFAIVSDLDDTIVQTEVLRPLQMLRHTFLENAYERLPFRGVPELYQGLQRGTGKTFNPIFYVSSSPWNLYDMITDFFAINRVPRGPIHLRHIGLNGESIGAADHTAHKLGYIEGLLALYPHLRFILIGDSGQKDAPIYAEVARRNAGRIAAIYIRDVGSDKHAGAVQRLAATLAAEGIEMQLVPDSLSIAQHAATQGFITAATLAEVMELFTTSSDAGHSG